MKVYLNVLLILVLLASAVFADVYMHNPRGSNDRNCRNDNGEDRRNANRLFDSQNNDKGGYSCPRTYPFPAGSAGKATVNEYGKITSSTTGDHIDTPTFAYYEGSELHAEWTSQHSCGNNDNTNCHLVIQYTCDYTPDSTVDTNIAAIISNKYIRDGTPVNNNDNDNTNDEATTTIPEDPASANCNNNNCAMDGRYGFQESYKSYQSCKARSRNYGLYTADQLPLNKNGNNRAINTRQNPNGERFGLECPEERDYYPYWAPTMWRDIAIGVSSAELDNCTAMVQQSQNVVDKCICVTTKTPAGISERECSEQQGKWVCGGKWNLPAPTCFVMPYSRDNHLGNAVGGASYGFNWTLPKVLDGVDSARCVFRIRYNISTGDFPETIDSRGNCDPNDNNCKNSPIADRDNREALTYLNILGETDERYNLSFAINTNQHSRTFQDRSYAFDIKKVPTDQSCNKIHNLNVRGKRGNIVQAYPAVEYDFTPQDLSIDAQDCVHIQWIGSDYNPNRNPNNGEGGPYNPNNVNEAKADRSNFVQMSGPMKNYPMTQTSVPLSFLSDKSGNLDKDLVRKFAFIDQDLSQCDTLTQLKARNPNNREARERDPRNCAKLNAAKNSYFQGALVKAYNEGTFTFVSTRNNNFSNRSQKAKIVVGECKSNCGDSTLSNGAIAGIVIGSVVGAAAIGFLAYKFGGNKLKMGTRAKAVA